MFGNTKFGLKIVKYTVDFKIMEYVPVPFLMFGLFVLVCGLCKLFEYLSARRRRQIVIYPGTIRGKDKIFLLEF